MFVKRSKAYKDLSDRLARCQSVEEVALLKPEIAAADLEPNEIIALEISVRIVSYYFAKHPPKSDVIDIDYTLID